jgi:hypothetical protein
VAIRTGAWDPTRVVAAQLLEIRAPTDGKTILVWAIQEPAQVGGPDNGPPGTESRVRYNFQVDFVNADSGKWLSSTDGYAPTGTPLG